MKNISIHIIRQNKHPVNNKPEIDINLVIMIILL